VIRQIAPASADEGHFSRLFQPIFDKVVRFIANGVGWRGTCKPIGPRRERLPQPQIGGA
jgi:hypothetical protein